MRSRSVVSGDVSLAVHEWGDAAAPTVVLIHGYPDTSAVWTPIAEQLAARFHVVTYDVRGAGDSTRPRRRADYRLDRLVDDLRRVIDATSPDRPVHLVGHDWGSIQGWEAVTEPTLQARIVSYTSVFAPGLDHAGRWVRERLAHPSPRGARQLVTQAARSWYTAAFHLPGAGQFWRLGAPAFTRFQARVEGVTATADYPASTLARDAAAGVELYRANFGERMRRPHDRTTDVPTQVIVCTEDHYVSAALAEGLEGTASRLWRVPVRAGHWLPRTHPDALARWITEFVDFQEGGPLPRRLARAAAADGRFDGSVVVVTGAGSGIGRATALAFAAAGATIVAVDIDEHAAAATAERARAEGASAEYRVADVGDAEAMEALAKNVVHDVGVPDVLVNNAGIGMAGDILDMRVEDWEQVLHVNLWGVIHGTRVFAGHMVERGEGGHIVNVASAAAYIPSRSYPAYATSKAACLMFTESLRAELAGAGIGVTAVCPGIVDTPITSSTRYVGVGDDEQERRRHAATRLYRMWGLKPERVAAAILDAVRRGTPLVPVGAEARAGLAVSRFAPRLLRTLARVDATPR